VRHVRIQLARRMRTVVPLVGAMMIVAVMAAVPGSASAHRAAAKPAAKKTHELPYVEKETFHVYKNCPVENPETFDCIFGRTTGGLLEVGSLKVKVSQPILLEGGIANPSESTNTEIIPPTTGVVLTPTPQILPHGILSVLAKNKKDKAYLQSCQDFESANCKVEGAAESVGPSHFHFFNLALEQGPAVEVAIRLHLTGSILGEHCYFGSAEEPIVLALTTGATSPPPPNESIHGTAGLLSEDPSERIVFSVGSEFVENAFVAPGAQGCGTPENEAETDALIDKKLGLPAPAGDHSTLILFGENSITTKTALEGWEAEQS
jgi:hypothetical protein